MPHPKLRILLLSLSVALSSGYPAGSDWPQWRGPARTDISPETGLLKSWPTEGPRRLWLFENAGHGYSGPAIAGGKLFTLGTRDGQEILLTLDAATGRELGITPLGAILDNDWGDGPRGTPTVDGDRVYALTGPGRLACVGVDGKEQWHVDMNDLGGQRPRWGYSESVLVHKNLVVCTPGGPKGTVAALDKLTGKLVWQSQGITEPAHYSSVVPAAMHGAVQLVQRNEKSVFAVAPADGKLLWQTSFPGRTAVIPTPVVRGNEVYVTAGYGAGSKLVRIGADHSVTEVYENKVMKNHHGGVVLIGEHLYGHADTGWVCQDFAKGEQVWLSRDLGKGAVSAADGMLYCLDERTGAVALVEASTAGWKERSRFTLNPQSKTRSPKGHLWTHPVISHGRLYLRDQEFVYCFDIRTP